MASPKFSAYVNWAVGTVVLFLVANALIGAFIPSASEEVFATVVMEAEECGEDDLTMTGYGFHSGFFGATCWKKFHIRGKKNAVRVTMGRSLHILPWRVVGYLQGGE